jgi:ribosomal protein S18 acetylase RimI-like enzyme
VPLYPATDDDLGSIATLVNLAYRGTEGWTHEGDFMEGLRTDAETLRRDLSANPDARLHTFRDNADGPLLGVVWLEPAVTDVWYLGMLTVRPDIQDRQLGRLILGLAEALAASQGARRIRMTVLNVREPLIAWYQRRGYCKTTETQPFPYDDQRFGVPKRADLAFVVMEKSIVEGRS